MTEPSFYAPLACAAEEAGYHSMVIPDSICYPRPSASVSPFTPDGSREFLEDKPFLEPFSLIPALGAVTGRLRFVTFVLQLPGRDPLLTAPPAPRPVAARSAPPPPPAPPGGPPRPRRRDRPVARGLRGARRRLDQPRP